MLNMFRDLEDIGCYIKVIHGCQQLDKETRYSEMCICEIEIIKHALSLRLNYQKFENISCRVLGLPADFKEGVVFSTYSTLVSSVHRAGTSNSIN
jgi:hypothetical protein